MKSSAEFGPRGIVASSIVVLTDIDPEAIETVSRLLTAGADVNATNSAGRSALHHAAAVLQPALVDLLLAHGARRDLRDTAGKTPLDIARESAGHSGPPLMFLRPDALIKLLED
jgi:ankyrin repeat protein